MKLHLRKTGSGLKTLIIIHGLYGSGDNWHSIAKNLNSDFTVYMPDLRNHGKSKHSIRHDYKAMVEDILELIEEIGSESVYLVGHSMGGKVAMFLTAKYPELVEKLIVVDIPPQSGTQLLDESPHALFHLNLINALLSVDFTNVETLADAEILLEQRLDDKRLVGFLLKNLITIDSKYQWRINLKSLMQNLPEIMEGLNIDDFIDNKIDTPVLFLKGTKSDYIKPEDKKVIDFIFSNNSIVDILDAGHWMHSEQPEKVIKNINEFIK